MLYVYGSCNVNGILQLCKHLADLDIGPGGKAAMAPRSSPTARRRRLATALRQLREAHASSLAEVSGALGWSESKLSRIETGNTGIRPA
ncbi:helix-turn-helix domain-containing protein, partial [Actinomadura hibisca]|uniref:helix-turn-helix domain-containing protein n=1 Tax=Actinomadura hibisca TaxID=68565 RepID=UPI0014726951